MQVPREAALLRIFLGEDKRHGHQPLYEVIVMKACELRLAGDNHLFASAPWP